MIGSLALRTPVAIAVAAVCATGVALTVSDQARSVVDMAPVGVWFANDDAASVSHVGPAGADATVRLERATGRLTVSELNGVAYVTDEAGNLSRIDPARLVVSQQAELPTARTQLVGGGDRMYVVDRESGVVRELDPFGLTTIGETGVLGSRLGRAVVDDDGVLWVPDLATGEVLAVDGRRVLDNVAAGIPGDDLRLAVVDGVVVALNPATGTVSEIAGERSDGTVHSLAIGDDGDLHLPSMVDAGSVLPMVLADDLVTIDLDDGSSVTVTLDADGHRLGPPVIVGDIVYVPDFTAGALIVVDLTDGVVTAVIEVTGEPGSFEVVADGDRVFVNDPASEQAWAVDDDGVLIPVLKYDPSQPGGRGGDGDGDGEIPPPPGLDEDDAPDDDDGDGDDDPADDAADDENDENDDAGDEPGPGDVPNVPDRDRTATSTTVASDAAAPTTTVPPVVIAPPATVPPSATTPPGNDDTGTTGGSTTGGTTGGTTGSGNGQTGGTTSDGGGAGTATTTTIVVSTTTTTTTTVPPSTTLPTTNPPITAPPGSGAVRDVFATGTDGGATVTWQPPVDWYPVTGYVVTVEPSGGDHQVATGQTRLDITGLANGDTYTFSVRALAADDQRGPSIRSNAVTPTPERPGPPLTVGADAGDGRVTVTWEPPATGRFTGYVVEVVPAGGGTVLTSPVPASQNEATITGLANGSSYHAIVRATVDGVAGEPQPTATFVPSGRPGRPGSVGASVTGSGEVTVTWTASNANGDAITDYTVSAPGATQRQVDGSTTSVVFTGLTPSQSYVFTVVATNGNGDGPGEASSAIVVQSLVPSAPTVVDTSVGDRSVTLTWPQPAANGSTIGSYRVRNVTDGTTQTVPASQRTDTFTNLTNGASYVFEVQAVSTQGAVGPAQQSAAATPVGPLPNPTGVSAAALAPDTVVVTFDAPPSANGNTIADWTVTINTSPSTSRTVTTGSATFNGLRPGTSYTVSVVARSTTGSTSGSATDTANTPSGVPAAVTGLTVEWAYWTSAKASWTPVAGAEWYTIDPGDGQSAIQVTAAEATWIPRFDGSAFTATVLAWTSWGSSSPRTVGYFVEPNPIDDCGGPGQLICP